MTDRQSACTIESFTSLTDSPFATASTSSSGSTGTPSIPSLHRDQSWTAYCLRSRDSCKDLGTLTAINRASMKMTPNGKSSSAGTPSESVFTPSPPPQSTNPTSRSYYSALRARKRELDEHLVSRSSSVQATNGSGSDIEAKKRKRRRDADLELQRQRDMDLAGLIGTVTKEDYGSSVKPPRSSRSSRPRSRTEVIQVVQVHEPEGQPREFSIETSAQNLGLGHRQRSFSMINDPQESEEVSEETQQGAGNSWLLWTWLLALLLFAVFLAVCGIMVYYEVVVARRVGGDHRPSVLRLCRGYQGASTHGGFISYRGLSVLWSGCLGSTSFLLLSGCCGCADFFLGIKSFDIVPFTKGENCGATANGFQNGRIQNRRLNIMVQMRVPFSTGRRGIVMVLVDRASRTSLIAASAWFKLASVEIKLE
ncbi:hypothetical protein P152DRAFT_451851 [Eremomyces bilateralis CBS 781.70]|uniref:Uncharacterized protein n=1 Tax=Eremomyces bilateralis CBS 781.70 TaxID=1392243 RepID=A0A6G1FVC3_9PEZI|nr:uncharacterized protein P152DRAFT_451851 [Eremomyces bilateralis CBS 781.70]KAF1809658.1 hypothetical protein P152DRAFT_451851 [Eremomyces bilateralis CBS 781.70]